MQQEDYTLSIVNPKGIPFTVVFHPDGGRWYDTPIIEFYDARYSDTDWGQFTGARYYCDTLFASASTHEKVGLNLQGGVDNWYVGADNMADVYDWLEDLGEKLGLN